MVIPNRRRDPVILDADNPLAFDENGILKDGYGFRVPLQMMDSAAPPRRASEPLVIETGLGLGREFYRDGRRRKVQDPMGRESGTFEEEESNDAMAAYRPGYRTVADAGAIAARDAAYAEMIDDLTTAWMPEHMKVADAQRATADARPPAGVSAGEWARHQQIIEDSTAWRSRPQDGSGPDTIKTEARRAPVDRANDRLTADMGDAQRDAYLEYCQNLTEAWRK